MTTTPASRICRSAEPAATGTCTESAELQESLLSALSLSKHGIQLADLGRCFWRWCGCFLALVIQIYSTTAKSQCILDDCKCYQASNLIHAAINAGLGSYWGCHRSVCFQAMRVDTMNVFAEERDREVRNILQSISDLTNIMRDLSVLVIDQGTILDRIDYNMEQASCLR